VDLPAVALLATAAVLGTVHTVTGPDHYVPFIAMARVREWSTARTVAITLACGVGHVGSSMVLGALGIGVGIAVADLQLFEGMRGNLAGWLLLAFGLVYTAWGLRRAARGQLHSHVHAHADGTVHLHGHDHHREHLHAHPATDEPKAGATGEKASITPWVLFAIFVFGPCEPLIPVLMVPAARGSLWQVAAVTLVFGACTLATMTVVVLLGLRGLARVSLRPLERYSHALAGLALVACGLAIQLGL